MRERLESDLAGVNRVLTQYELEKDEDYQTINDADLGQVLDIIDGAAARAIAAELDRIVGELDAGVKKLPVEAIREAQQHRDLMVPRLIEVLSSAASEARAGRTPEGNAHFFAIFLLTEFQAEEALPAILEAFSLPGESPFDLFGDAVTSTLAKILAQLAGNRPQVMDGLIADRALNEYVRWEAAQSYVHLVRDGRISREEAVQRLRQHLRQAIDDDDAEIASGLVCVLTSFAPQEALQEITEAYDRSLIDRGFIRLQDVERCLAEGVARVRKELDRCAPTGIEDTIDELRHWAAFREEKPAPPPRPPAPLPPPPQPSQPVTSSEPLHPENTPVSSRGQRVGRNEPCPCGSGKKFKKCCGRRT